MINSIRPSSQVLTILASLTNPRHSTTMTAVCRLAIDSQSPQIWTNSFNQHALGIFLRNFCALPVKNELCPLFMYVTPHPPLRTVAVPLPLQGKAKYYLCIFFNIHSKKTVHLKRNTKNCPTSCKAVE